MNRLTIPIALLFLAIGLSNAQTIIPANSEVFGTWTKAGSPYLVQGKATVPNGKTLIIEPGVVVKLKPGTNFDFDSPGFDAGTLFVDGGGNLIAEGTKNDSITFTRNGETGNWGIIYLLGNYTNPDSTKLRFCHVRYASKIKKPFNNQQEQTGAITLIDNKKVSIRNSTISDNMNNGIIAERVSPLISGNRITKNGGDAIHLRVGSTPFVVNNYISGNGSNGIYFDGSGSCTFFGNIISFNKNGIYEQSQFYTCKIINNTIYGNQEYGLFKSNSFTNGKSTFCINSIITNNGTNTANSKYLTLMYCLTDNNSLPSEVKVSYSIYSNRLNFVDFETFKLNHNSPAINAGTLDAIKSEQISLSDIYGNNRIQNDSIDIGAVEYTGKFLYFIQPQDGAYLQKGKNENISWKANMGNVKLEYSINSGANWLLAVSSTENDGSYAWNVPASLPDSCLLKISDISDNTLSDTLSLRLSSSNIIGNKELVYGTWTKDRSPYIIMGEAIVPKGKTLQIEPGVTVKLKTGTTFDYESEGFDAGMINVCGKMLATGRLADTIRFTRYGDTGFFGTILFQEPADTSILSFCAADYGSATLNHSQIADPTGYYHTGAISLKQGLLKISNSRISNNKFLGINAWGSVLYVDSCKVVYNYSGVLNYGRIDTCSVVNCTVSHNFNDGIYNRGDLQIIGNTVTGNKTGIVSVESGTLIKNNYISDNETGISCWRNFFYKPVILNNNISHNNLGVQIGNTNGLIINNLFSGNNTAINTQNWARISLTNNTIYGSSTAIASYGYSTKLTNSILWNNHENFMFEKGISLQNSLIEEKVIPEGVIDLGENLFGIYPAFSDTLNNDFSLLHESPCINSGVIDTSGFKLPLKDFPGNDRISNGRIDMGAYEYQDDSDFIRITKPYFHEFLVSNLYYDLKWNLKDSLSSVKLIFSPDKGLSWETITTSTPNDGRYTWKIPEIFADSCLWAVINPSEPTLSDTSRYYFTITPNIIPDGSNIYGVLKEKYSPYKILGIVTVPNDSVLTIEPGTEIRLKTGDDYETNLDPDINVSAVNVYGNLIAQGERDNEIRFTRLGESGYWGSIVVYKSVKNYSRFAYCILEFANKYKEFSGALNISYNGVYPFNETDSITVLNSVVRNSTNGIYIGPRVKGSLIQNSIIYNNKNNGIDGYHGNIINCTISGNGANGISGMFSIRNCIIYSNPKSVVNPFGHNSFNEAKLGFTLIEEENFPAHFINKGGMIFHLPPQFKEPYVSDYHLAANSPCIDTGNPADDYSLEPLPNGGRIDMGAFGNTPEATSFQAMPRIDFLSAYQYSVLGNDTIMITGKYFGNNRGNGKVIFGTAETSKYLQWNDSLILCIMPPHTPGPVAVSVTDSTGLTGTRSGLFTYHEPYIIKVDEPFGPAAGGKTISLTGKNFGIHPYTTSIWLGEVQVSSTTSWSDTMITLTIPANSGGLKDLVFTSSSITHNTPGAFLYTDASPVSVCGNVSGDWPANSIYFLECDVVVPANQTLTIGKGVTIISAIRPTPLSFTVNGILNVEGTAGDTVLFTSIPEISGNWKGLIINKATNIQFADIRSASDGIKVRSTDFELNNSRISGHKNRGLFFEGYELSSGGLVQKCLIENNGTGIECDAYCSTSGGSASPSLWNNLIQNNLADGIRISAKGSVPSSGTATRTAYASPNISGNIISNNHGFALNCTANDDEAQSVEGIMMRRYGFANPIVSNNVIHHNHSIVSAVNFGYISNADITLVNNTVYNSGGIFSNGAKIKFINSILAENPPEIDSKNYGSVVFDYCCIKGETGTNIANDPLFTDAESGDFHLMPGSPCIDAGSNAHVDSDQDLNGKIRIWDGNKDGTVTVDIGAFEFGSVAEMAPGITLQPVGGTLCPGSKIELQAEALAYPVAEYQWFHNEFLIQGATSKLLEFYLDQTKTGKYYCKAINKLGSTTTDTISISVHPVYNLVLQKSICEGDTFEINGIPYTTDTLIMRNLVSVSGCDSLVTTQLSIYPSIQPLVEVNGDTLRSLKSYPAYQWNDPQGLIPGANNQRFVISKSGKYYLTITDENGCKNTSAEYNLIFSDLTSRKTPAFRYSIIPNPNSGRFDFRIDSRPGSEVTLRLLNPAGQVIDIRNLGIPFVNSVETYNITNMAHGLYLLVIVTEEGFFSEKVVIR